MPLAESKVRALVRQMAADPMQAESIPKDMIKSNPVIADVVHLCRRVNALSAANRRLATELALERCKPKRA